MRVIKVLMVASSVVYVAGKIPMLREEIRVADNAGKSGRGFLLGAALLMLVLAV